MPALVLIVVVILAPGASAQEEPAQSVTGTLEVDDNGVEGVRIAVADAAGAAVGEDRTDGEGSWQVPLPAPGAYRVTIDEQSLPEG